MAECVGEVERDRVVVADGWKMGGHIRREPGDDFCLVQHAVGLEQYDKYNDWDSWPLTP